MTADLVREILDATCYVTLATADEAGTPWASPVFFAHDDYRELYWVSHQDVRHSENIGVRKEIGCVVFDSTQPINTGQAAYMSAIAEPAVDLEHGMAVFSRGSIRWGGVEWGADRVSGSAPLRLYRAKVTAHYVLQDGVDKRVRVEL